MVAGILLVITTSALYCTGQRTNPPGFFVDESSIALNALEIARHGTDEFGTPFPLYFRAFGEYKNPVYIYLLAGVFEAFSPAPIVARRFSALLGYLAAVVIGLLAWRLTRRRWIAAIVFLMALATPMLFEISRLAFEVALYPLLVALFLLTVRVASERERWSWRLIATLLVLLILLTFTYTIGRLFAPLMLICLEVFHSPERRRPLRTLAVLYVLLALLPIALYERSHPRAMTERLGQVSYLSTYILTPLDLAVQFEKHYTANLLPMAMALEGDPTLRHHVPNSGGSILLATFILAIIGGAEVVRRRGREDRWWWFVFLGTFVSIIPASLTLPDNHTLRLSPYPLFLIVLSIPALEWLAQQRVRRFVLAAILLLGVAQSAFFFTRFSNAGPSRDVVFDTDFPRLLDIALTRGPRPIYVDDSPASAHAFWYGAVRGLDRSAIAPLPKGAIKPGALLIGGKDPGGRFERIAAGENYALYESR